ncbi:uncharacterized protein LOC135221277 [Macrobrachium nipponense]|uniref:uncharacterized protein LOC135221277 n=1 Tax=Macrobrachium nipponense TaxID=159736 RepID=UPI0030C7A51D
MIYVNQQQTIPFQVIMIFVKPCPHDKGTSSQESTNVRATFGENDYLATVALNTVHGRQFSCNKKMVFESVAGYLPLGNLPLSCQFKMDYKHPLMLLLACAISTSLAEEIKLRKALQKPSDTTLLGNKTFIAGRAPRSAIVSLAGDPEVDDPMKVMGMASSNNYSYFLLSSQEDVVLQVGISIWQIVRQKVDKCQFIFVTEDSDQSLIMNVLRQSFMFTQPLVLIDLNSRLSSTTQDDLFRAIWGTATAVCRTILVDLTAENESRTFRFLEDSKLWLWPEANVVFVGNRRRARPAFQQPALRNTCHLIFVGLHEEMTKNAFVFKSAVPVRTYLANHSRPPRGSNKLDVLLTRLPSVTPKSQIGLYTRCLYCDDGQPKTWLLSSWPLGSDIPHHTATSEISNLQGHRLNIVSIAYPPYAIHAQGESGPGGEVVMLDSLDKRLLDTISPRVNFTYGIRSPKEIQFGIQQNGSWSGMMGVIQRKEADFTTIMGYSADRASVIDHQKTIDIEQLIITSLKPQALTQYLLLLRPFSAEVWIFLVVSMVVWGVSLWYLLRTRSQYSGEKPTTLSSAFFNSFAIVLGVPPSSTPTSATGQVNNIIFSQAIIVTDNTANGCFVLMLVGWWLIAGLLISTGFKSSLVAHLTVEGKTPPIDTFGDLVKLDGWKWGFDDRILTGLVLIYLRDSTDKDIQEIYKRHEKISPEEGLKKVLKGRYSLLSTKDRVIYLIGTQYIDEYGQSPFYISKQSYNIVPALGWGFRKGAPFRRPISKLIRQLTESGLSNRWLNELVTINIRQIRETTRKQQQQQQQDSKEVNQMEEVTTESGGLVIRMVHMMGVYLLLCGGLVLSSLVFAAEKCTQRCSS